MSTDQRSPSETLQNLDRRQKLADRGVRSIRSYQSAEDLVMFGRALLNPGKVASKAAQSRRNVTGLLVELARDFPELADVVADPDSNLPIELRMVDQLESMRVAANSAQAVLRSIDAYCEHANFISTFAVAGNARLYETSEVRVTPSTFEKGSYSLGLTPEQTNAALGKFFGIEGKILDALVDLNAKTPKKFWTSSGRSRAGYNNIRRLASSLQSNDEVQTLRRDLIEVFASFDRGAINNRASLFESHKSDFQTLIASASRFDQDLANERFVQNAWSEYFNTVEGSAIAEELGLRTEDALGAGERLIDIARGIELLATAKPTGQTVGPAL